MKKPIFLALVVCSLGGSVVEPVFAQVSLDAFPKLDAIRDWPWWRGVGGDGYAPTKDVPTILDEAQNLDWSTPIPGRGHSSPTVVGQRVYLLTADDAQQTQSALALDRETGKILWTTELNQGGFPEHIHAKNTHASSTIACDGERLFAVLYHHEAIWLTSLNLDGEKVWEQKLGRFNPTLFRHGYGASPILYGDHVIVAYEYDGPSAIVALRRADGKEAWRATRSNMLSYSTPAIISHQGKDYMVLSGNNQVAAYDPANGDELWSAKGTALATCGTAVHDQGIAFASGGYPASETVGIDLISGEVLWRVKTKAYEQSMLAIGGNVYCYAEGGIMFCWDAKTGNEMWKKRLGDPTSPSGVVVGDNIYWSNEAGTFYIFKATPDGYHEVFQAKLGDETFASPAICGGEVFLRVAKYEQGDRRQEYLLKFSQR